MKTSDPLWEGAQASLAANLETVGTHTYLTAGRHQFRSLWSRDFCFSVRGLIAIGRLDVVREQLSLLIENRRAQDALIPRTLDSVPAQWRVARQVLNRIFPWFFSELPIGADLKPEYVSENRTEAIDSNVLVLLAAVSYLQASGDQSWWAAHLNALIEIYRYYDAKKQDGLISQPAFSDWQDSVRRDGKTFLTNLLYWKAASELRQFTEFGITDEELKILGENIQNEFFDPKSGLYISWAAHPQLSLDGNLLALDFGFVQGTKATQLVSALELNSLWTSNSGLPGFATYPDYSAQDISVQTKWVGLRYYHDRMYWSWLLGLSLKTARRFGAAATEAKIRTTLEQALARDGSIVELYSNDSELTAWKSFLLEAERPFSWGASFVLDALTADPS